MFEQEDENNSDPEHEASQDHEVLPPSPLSENHIVVKIILKTIKDWLIKDHRLAISQNELIFFAQILQSDLTSRQEIYSDVVLKAIFDTYRDTALGFVADSSQDAATPFPKLLSYDLSRAITAKFDFSADKKSKMTMGYDVLTKERLIPTSTGKKRRKNDTSEHYPLIHMAGVTFGESYTPDLQLARILAFTQNASNIEKDVHRISNSLSLYVHSGDLIALGKIVKVKNSTEGAIANKTNYYWSTAQSEAMDNSNEESGIPKVNIQSLISAPISQSSGKLSAAVGAVSLSQSSRTKKTEEGTITGVVNLNNDLFNLAAKKKIETDRVDLCVRFKQRLLSKDVATADQMLHMLQCPPDVKIKDLKQLMGSLAEAWFPVNVKHDKLEENPFVWSDDQNNWFLDENKPCISMEELKTVWAGSPLKFNQIFGKKLASTKVAVPDSDQDEVHQLAVFKAAHDSSTKVSAPVIPPVLHLELRNILKDSDMSEHYDYLVSLGVTSKLYLLLIVKEDLTEMLPIPQRALLALIENLKRDATRQSGEKRHRSSEQDKDKRRQKKKGGDHHHYNHGKDEDRDSHKSGSAHRRHRSH